MRSMDLEIRWIQIVPQPKLRVAPVLEITNEQSSNYVTDVDCLEWSCPSCPSGLPTNLFPFEWEK